VEMESGLVFFFLFVDRERYQKSLLFTSHDCIHF
jgi:hypothetical protein